MPLARGSLCLSPEQTRHLTLQTDSETASLSTLSLWQRNTIEKVFFKKQLASSYYLVGLNINVLIKSDVVIDTRVEVQSCFSDILACAIFGITWMNVNRYCKLLSKFPSPSKRFILSELPVKD